MAQRDLYPPSIHFSLHSPGSTYGSQLQESHHGPYHIPARRSRNARYNVPSPSASMMANNVAPLTRPYDSASFSHSEYVSTEPPIDPSLDEIPFASHSGRSSPSTFTQNTEPWGPHNLRSTSTQHLSPHVANFRRYHPGPGSIGKQSVPDSGYQSHSAVSNDFGACNVDSQHTSMSRASSQHRSSIALIEPPKQLQIPSDQQSHVSSQSVSHDKSFRCQQCTWSCKCKSDFRKHMLRHEKPFICKEPHCKRDGEGFTTQNDLDRHKKSVHGVKRLEGSYKCVSPACRSKEKIWPRQDNFKQHVERMHKHEDLITLMQASIYVPLPQIEVQQNDGIDPQRLRELDGMGSTFSNENGNFPEALWPSNINHAELAIESQPLATMFDIALPHGNLATSGQRSMSTSRNNLQDSRSLPARQQPTKSRPKISDAPQTKAQQTQAAKQSKALEKLSGAIMVQTSGSSAPFNLGDSIQRLFSMDDSESGLTKTDALKALQAMTDLVKSSTSSNQQSRGNTQHGFASDLKTCHICQHSVTRDCDLRKHMKRHERPFGCTYPKCHKRFGAKSDWKRHENSQHFQLEAYRCHECGEHFQRVEKFETHLKSKHNVTDQAEIEKLKKSRKIGKNCQGSFWCGFHKDVIPLMKRRNAAWDERFDHIATHFKEGEKIDDWLCAEENKMKKDLSRKLDRYAFDDEDDRDTSVAGDIDELPSCAIPTQPSPPEHEGYTPQASGPLKRKGIEEPVAPESDKRRGTHHDLVHYCCQCRNGPYGPTQLSCYVCEHPLLSGCCFIEAAQGQ